MACDTVSRCSTKGKTVVGGELTERAHGKTVIKKTTYFILVALALGAAACNSKTAGATHSGNARNNVTAAVSSVTVAAGAAFVPASNTMNKAENLDIPSQNAVDTDPAGASAAINDRVSIHHTFDTTVSAIRFPDCTKADARRVLDADAALERALGTLASNTNDISTYNSLFRIVTPAQSAFAAADTALSGDLGLISVTVN